VLADLAFSANRTAAHSAHESDDPGQIRNRPKSQRIDVGGNRIASDWRRANDRTLAQIDYMKGQIEMLQSIVDRKK
jgi:hypothetical protein